MKYKIIQFFFIFALLSLAFIGKQADIVKAQSQDDKLKKISDEISKYQQEIQTTRKKEEAVRL